MMLTSRPGYQGSRNLTEKMTLIHYSTLKKSVTFQMLLSTAVCCEDSSKVMLISLEIF